MWWMGFGTFLFWFICHLVIYLYCIHTTSFEKMSWFEYWKHAFLKVIRMSSKVLYQHCMLSRYVGIVFWMQKIQRNSSNGQFHCFHYVRKRAPCAEMTYFWWKLEKRKRIFLNDFHQYDLNEVYHEKADVLGFPKMW